MNAEEMQRKIIEYEQKINDDERRMVRYQRMIGNLEDVIFNRDDEIRRAKYTILQALPQLNPPVIDDLFVDPEVRNLGYLDLEIFTRAYLKVIPGDPSINGDEEVKKDKAYIHTDVLRSEWIAKIHGDWMLHITGPDQEEGDELDLVRM